ncbi:MAG: hypothetical protein R2873_34955 [Caldilineaceae bacterium]
MNTRELQIRLAQDGCNPGLYAVGVRGSASNAFCLTHNGVEWQVYYTERGVNQAPMFTSPSEEDACAYFYNLMSSIRHEHCVGIFRSEDAARALEDRLDQLGIASRRNDFPYGGPDDRRYRVFVEGKAIFAMRAAFPVVPLRDG